jgi:hypothetical protein
MGFKSLELTGGLFADLEVPPVAAAPLSPIENFDCEVLARTLEPSLLAYWPPSSY